MIARPGDMADYSAPQDTQQKDQQAFPGLLGLFHSSFQLGYLSISRLNLLQQIEVDLHVQRALTMAALDSTDNAARPVRL